MNNSKSAVVEEKIGRKFIDWSFNIKVGKITKIFQMLYGYAQTNNLNLRYLK